MASSPPKSTIYFAYGSNLWLDQMKSRCPESTFLGIALLPDWRFIISMRGYGNVVPSEGDIVYGFVYKLSVDDEKSLDKYEGVPHSYIKRKLLVEYRGQEDFGEVREGKKKIDALVYVDLKHLEDDRPKEEYIYRMNMAIKDALQEGVPKEYIDKYLRPFIPADINE